MALTVKLRPAGRRQAAARWLREVAVMAGERCRFGLRRRDDSGTAVAEFAMVSVLLLFLLFAVMQVAIYLHVRNIVVASAAEGARYAANANVDPELGASRAIELIRKGAGNRTAADISCTGSEETDSTGLQIVRIRCIGSIEVFFLPIGANVLPIDISARSLKEGA